MVMFAALRDGVKRIIAANKQQHWRQRAREMPPFQSHPRFARD
jgi:hypothetical protein